MKNSNKSLSKPVRAALIGLAAVLLQFNVPSTETLGFAVCSADDVRLKPPVVIVQPVKQLYASAKTQLQSCQHTIEKYIAKHAEAEKTWKIVKVQTKKATNKSIMWPVRGAITSRYGMRIHPVTGRHSFHSGIDIRGKRGTKVLCPTDGVVVDTGWQGALGRMVKVKTSTGHILYFGHLSAIKCKEGQKLNRGQLLGTVGATGRATGPHLHFAVVYNGDFMNPVKYLSKR